MIKILRKTIISLSFLLFTFSLLQAQSTPEPLYNDVYNYLSRLAQKGVIEFNDEVKPLSRKYIFEKLLEVKSVIWENGNPASSSTTPRLGKGDPASSSTTPRLDNVMGNKYIRYKVTELENEELEFFLKDYYLEAMVNGQRSSNSEQFFKDDFNSNLPIFLTESFGQHSGDTLTWFSDAFGRYRLFSYSSKVFKVNFDPILGYEFGKQEQNKYSHLWNGIKFYGYISDWIGFSFDFRDNTVNANDDYYKDLLTPETGFVISRRTQDHFEYSRTNTSISTDWSWGSFMVGKEPINWGYGESGLFVHSTKAPSYPMMRLDLYLTSWLRFNYFHGWLQSNVIDSSASYATTRENQERTIFRTKYIASHSLLITPTKGLSISLGESVVYSDKLEVLYLFPLMFYRAADHYLSDASNNAGANSQFFLGVSSRNHIPNTHLYGTFFIDEVTVGDIFDPEKQRTQYAFQIGGSVVDFPINNLQFTVEYTKLYPFVYRHYITTQTYENHDYVLGDWIEHNSDRIYGSLNYRFIRGLQLKIWGEYIRKGGDGIVDDQYTTPQPPFLFGLRTNYTRWGAELKYEIIHDLFARIRYNNFLTSRETDEDVFEDSRMSEFYFGVYYGM